jgi:hypothetical protein
MSISQELIKLVPIGEEHAVTGRLLWKQLGMWSLAAVKAKLCQMAAEGLVERKRDLREARQTSLYFRTPKPRAGAEGEGKMTNRANEQEIRENLFLSHSRVDRGGRRSAVALETTSNYERWAAVECLKTGA